MSGQLRQEKELTQVENSTNMISLGRFLMKSAFLRMEVLSKALRSASLSQLWQWPDSILRGFKALIFRSVPSKSTPLASWASRMTIPQRSESKYSGREKTNTHVRTIVRVFSTQSSMQQTILDYHTTTSRLLYSAKSYLRTTIFSLVFTNIQVALLSSTR